MGEAFVAVKPETTGFGGAAESQLTKAISAIPSGAVFAGLVVGAGAAALAIGESFEDAYHTIAERTGQTGDALAGLEGVFKDVLASTPGADFHNTADAISEISQRTGLTGKALEDFAAKEIELGKITKTDVGQNVQETTGLFNLWGIAVDQQSSKLDVLFKASQLSGTSLSTIDSVMSTLGPRAQAVGLTFDQTAAIVANLSKAGIPAAAAFTGLGAEFAKAAKAGQDPLVVLKDLQAQMLAAPTPTAAARIAIDKFGLGARQAFTLVTALRSGSLQFGATLAEITNGQGGINETAFATLSLSDKFALLKNKALVGLEPIGEKVVELANFLVDLIPPALDKIGDGFSAVGDALAPTFAAIQEAVDIFVGTLTGSGFDEELGGWRSSVYDFGLTARSVFDTLVSFWDSKLAPVVHAIGDYFSDHLQPIIVAVGVAVGVLVGAAGFALLASIIGTVVSVLGILVGALASPIFLIGALVAGLVYAYEESQTFRDIVSGALDVVKTAFSDVLGGVEDFIGGFTKGTDAIGSAQSTWAVWGAVAYEVFQKIVGKVKEFVDEAGPRLADMWQRAGDIWNNDVYPALHDKLLPVLQDIGNWIREHLTPVLIGLAIGLGLLISPVGTVAAGLVLLYEKSDLFRSIVDTTAGIVRSLGEELVKFGGPLLANVKDSIASFATFFIDRWDHIKGSFQTILLGFKILLAVTFGPLVFLWTHFHEQIMAVVKFVWNQVLNIMSTALRIIGDVFDIITSLLSGDWGGAWDAVKDIFGAIFDYIVSTLANIWQFARDFFSTLPGNLLSALGDIAGLLVSLGGKLLGGLLSGLETAVPAVLGFFLGLPARFLDAVIGINTWLIEKGAGLLLGLLQGLVDHLPDVLGFFVGLPGAVVSALPDVASWLLQKGLDILGGLLSGLIEKAPEVASFFIGLPGTVLGWLGDVVPTLLSKGWDLLIGLLQGLGEKEIELAGWVIGLPGRIIGWIGDTAPTLIGKAWDLVLGMLQGLGSIEWKIIDWFTGLPGRIIGWIGDIAGSMVGVGQAALMGFIAGIQSLGDAVGGAVGGVIKGGINGIIGLFNSAIDFIDGFGIHVHLHPPWPLPSLDFDWNGLGIGHIPTLHTGGIVPGRPGQEVMAKLMAGEVVLSPTSRIRADFGAPPQQAVDMTETNGLLRDAVDLLRRGPQVHVVASDGGTPPPGAQTHKLRVKKEHQLVA